MIYNPIPNTDIQVSKICLGTMTWGEQNSQEEAFEQLDFAFEQGVNFLDTAELYPVPHKASTFTNTESIIGKWLRNKNNRQDVVIATKISGFAPMTEHIRPLGYTKSELTKAVDASLSRLQTDYIDLYQLHWPERQTNFFGQLNYPYAEKWNDNFLEVLTSLNELVQEGKIRHIGLSNETPWGVLHSNSIAKQQSLKPFVSIQNPYSLLNRTFEIGLSEICHYEDIKLLAYSPLAFGRLTGKYNDGTATPFSRLNQFTQFSRYSNEQCLNATSRYIALAKNLDISPTQLALAFVNSRPFLYSNIIGATSLSQLKENISSIDISITEEIEQAIDQIHHLIPNPAP